jgi:zinc-ribbon domain
MFCSTCGTQLIDGAVFCSKCGARVSVDAAPVTSVARAQVAGDDKGFNWKALSLILTFGGGAVLVGAIFWWQSYYEPLARRVGKNLGEALPCLYSSSGVCGFAEGVGQLLGQIPYNPIAFWIGVVGVIFGFILSAVAPRAR